MKNWFAKYRISSALDTKAQPRPSVAPTANEELRDFETSLLALDQRLKATPIRRSVPVGLHTSTMQALNSVRPEPAGFGSSLPRWWPAPALASLIILGSWLAFHPAKPVKQQAANSTKPKRVTLVSAMDEGRGLTQVAPGQALAPLSTELEKLNRDLKNAVSFLAASVP